LKAEKSIFAISRARIQYLG